MKKASSLVERHLPLFDYMPDHVWDIMDCENRFVYANSRLNQLVGVKPDYDFVGRYMAEPPAACYEVSSAEFVDQNNLCVTTQRDLKILDIHPGSDGNWFVYIFHKKPIFENQEVVGTLHHGYPVLDQWRESIMAFQHLVNFYTGSKSVSATFEGSETLSDEQLEVLFFLLCRKVPKDIARILNVKTKAIYKRIDRLKEHFGVGNMSQLVEVTVVNGLYKQLPQRLVTEKHLSLIIDS